MGRGSGVSEALDQEVRAVEISGTGTVLSGPGDVVGLYIASQAGGGAITLRDGGAGGTIKLPLTHPAVAGGTMIPIPKGRIRFATDIYATLAAGIDTITVFIR